MKTAQLIKKAQKGFTLIELLVVIGILAVLLAIVLIAINPAKEFSAANNTKRQSDVNAILNAIDQYMADNSGQLPPNMPAAGATETIASGTGNADICSSLVTKYLAALPQDPKSNNGAPITTCTGYNTGYTVTVSNSDNRITISAPDAENGATISVTR